MHAAADEGSEPAGRTVQSLSADRRSRYGVYSMVAVRRGLLVRKAMLTDEKPWWTT